MSDFSNNLTPAQAERLAILAEECAEVIQIVGKILRHGYESYNPMVPESHRRPNSDLLRKELGDVVWAIGKLDTACDIDFYIPDSADMQMWKRRKENTAAPFLHHQ